MLEIPGIKRRSHIIASAIADLESKTHTPKQAPPTQTMPKGSITAATQRLAKKFGWKKNTNSGWTDQAWAFYDSVPELRFASNWIGNAMSHARLYAGEIQDDGSIAEAPDGHPAHDYVRAIANGPVGQSQFLQAFGPQLTVAGEAYVVIHDGQWWVLSNQELRRDRGKIIAEIEGDEYQISDGAESEGGPDAFRIWRPHPRRYIEADSPVRSSLRVLSELELLTDSVMAIARSRMTGRGVLFVPQGARFPTTPGQSDAEDDLFSILSMAAETAVQEPDSAAAAVPILVELPAERISEIKHLTFESHFDELALKLREEAIRRLAAGTEIPAEYLLGMGDVNHWGVFALHESAIRTGVEPVLATVCDRLTRDVLWPNLDPQTAKNFVVWYDTSKLRTRANKAQSAFEAYDRGVITAEALRRELGFSDDDAETEADSVTRVIMPNGLPANLRRPNLPVSETEAAPDENTTEREAA